MRGEADAVGERRRHGVAMRGDVRDLPAREPELQRERGGQRGEEQRR